jgi:hypothetical protein
MLYSWRFMSDGRAFWESAADRNGNKFPLEISNIKFKKSNDIIPVTEWSGAQVSQEYLERIRKTGGTWRFYSKITATAPIDSHAVDGFPMKVDEVFKE